MGKEIVYCQGCGNNLREEDFEKARAHMVDNRPFCSACKPLPKTESPRPRKASTGRIPVPPGQAARRPAPTRPAQVPNTPLLVGGIVAALVVLMLLVVLAAGGGRAKPPTPAAASSAREGEKRGEPATGDRTDADLAQIRELIKTDTLFARRREAIRLIETARANAGARVGELDRVRAEYDRTYEDAARRLAEFCRTEAGRLAAQKKVDEAIRKCDEYLESFSPAPAAESIRKLRQDLEKQRNP